jgi:hypothetical protein
MIEVARANAVAIEEVRGGRAALPKETQVRGDHPPSNSKDFNSDIDTLMSAAGKSDAQYRERLVTCHPIPQI